MDKSLDIKFRIRLERFVPFYDWAVYRYITSFGVVSAETADKPKLHVLANNMDLKEFSRMIQDHIRNGWSCEVQECIINGCTFETKRANVNGLPLSQNKPVSIEPTGEVVLVPKD